MSNLLRGEHCNRRSNYFASLVVTAQHASEGMLEIEMLIVDPLTHFAIACLNHPLGDFPLMEPPVVHHGRHFNLPNVGSSETSYANGRRETIMGAQFPTYFVGTPMMNAIDSYFRWSPYSASRC